MRVVEAPPQTRVRREAHCLSPSDEVQRLLVTVRTYQIYLAVALAVLALIAALHLAVLVPMIGWRLLARVRRWANPPPLEKILPDEPPID